VYTRDVYICNVSLTQSTTGRNFIHGCDAYCYLWEGAQKYSLKEIAYPTQRYIPLGQFCRVICNVQNESHFDSVLFQYRIYRSFSPQQSAGYVTDVMAPVMVSDYFIRYCLDDLVKLAVHYLLTSLSLNLLNVAYLGYVMSAYVLTIYNL